MTPRESKETNPEGRIFYRTIDLIFFQTVRRKRREVVLDRGWANYSLWRPPLFFVKFYWHTTVLICLRVV